MTVTLFSFGYHKGEPSGCDVIFDARGITNPARKGKEVADGRDYQTQMEVIQDPKAKAIVRSVVEIARAKPDAIIAVGCRYGKHRSVAIVERIAKGLVPFSDMKGNKLTSHITHLDLPDEPYFPMQDDTSWEPSK